MTEANFRAPEIDRDDTELRIISATVDFIGSSLAGCYRTRGSDSVTIQRIRESGFDEDSRVIAQVIEDLKEHPEYELVLRLPEDMPEPADQYYAVVSKGYGLEAGVALSLNFSRMRRSEDLASLRTFLPFSNRMAELFVGHSGKLVPLSTVARILEDGADLEIREVLSPDSSSEASLQS